MSHEVASVLVLILVGAIPIVLVVVLMIRDYRLSTKPEEVMRAYGKQELQVMINKAYEQGWSDRELRRDGKPEPPQVDDLVKHTLESSDHPDAYRKRPWLDNLGPKMPEVPK